MKRRFKRIISISITLCMMVMLIPISAITALAAVTHVTINEIGVSVEKGGSYTFTAAVDVTESENTNVIWSLSDATYSSIDADTGKLSVGADETSTTLGVIAASVADPNFTDIKTVNITEPYVAENETTSVQYTSLSTAVSSALNGDTITLLYDVDLNNDTAANKYISPSDGCAVTLDLNGYDIKGTLDDCIYVNGGCTLTLTDSNVTPGTIHDNHGNAVWCNGTLIMENITIQSNGIGINLLGGDHIFTMNSGTIDAGAYGVAVYNGGGTFNFNGGTVIGDSAAIYSNDTPEVTVVVPAGKTLTTSTHGTTGTTATVETFYPVKVTKGGTTTGYSTLNAAFNSVGSGETAEIKLYDNITLTNQISINSERTITLDLNGYTITAPTAPTIFFNYSGTLYLTDSTDSPGTIQNNCLDGTVLYNYGGTAEIENITINSTLAGILSYNGSVVMNSGTINSDVYGVHCQYGTFKLNAGTIKGATKAIYDEYGTAYDLGVCSEYVTNTDTEVTVQLDTTPAAQINGVDASSFEAAFGAVPSNGTATIKLLDNVTVSKEFTVTYLQTITLDLNGYNINSGVANLFSNYGTLNLTDSSDLPGTIQSTVTNGSLIYNTGTVSMDNIAIVSAYNGVVIAPNSSFTMNSGDINASNYGVVYNGGTFTIKSGDLIGNQFAFYNKNTSTAWTGYTLGSGSGYVKNTGTEVQVQIGSSAAVAQIGSTTYPSLEDAFAAVPTTGVATTIKLLADTDLIDMVTIPNGKTITLDLNGYDITASTINEMFQNNGILNLTDSSNTPGTIQDTCSGNCIVFNMGTASMENITLKSTYTGVAVYYGTFTMNSGTIDSDVYGVVNCATGSFILNAGAITGDTMAFCDFTNSHAAWTGYTLGSNSEYVTNTATEVTAKLKSASSDGDDDDDSSSKNNDDDDNSPSTGSSTGWSGIQNVISSASNGDSIEVNMNGTNYVPGSILSSIKGKDIDLVLNMVDYIWTINGNDVDDSDTINLGVILNPGNGISSTLVNNLAGTRSVIQLRLNHEGSFGFAAKLKIKVGKQYKGQYANLYYHNETSNKLEYQTNGKVDENGYVELDFSHASSYAIVMDSKPMTDELSAGAPMRDSSTPIKAENTLPYAIILVTFTAGMIVYKQKKNKALK